MESDNRKVSDVREEDRDGLKTYGEGGRRGGK